MTSTLTKTTAKIEKSQAARPQKSPPFLHRHAPPDLNSHGNRCTALDANDLVAGSVSHLLHRFIRTRRYLDRPEFLGGMKWFY